MWGFLRRNKFSIKPRLVFDTAGGTTKRRVPHPLRSWQRVGYATVGIEIGGIPPFAKSAKGGAPRGFVALPRTRNALSLIHIFRVCGESDTEQSLKRFFKTARVGYVSLQMSSAQHCTNASFQRGRAPSNKIPVHFKPGAFERRGQSSVWLRSCSWQWPISLHVCICGLVGRYFCLEPIHLSAKEVAQSTGYEISISKLGSFTISARRCSSACLLYTSRCV